ncbi:hypothetical protein [Chryseobacterium gallinarum]|uniref:Cadherin domain-containing protein n=1 Tax=Chryseobacterium gallinarum TaxID=1324352 RepID=A0ABX6KUT1_CHRGL|nr:hypothetical protein [Chryseobacterium gallinarum]QIY92247.1 hypothetical protein FOB44_16950 [Chryseobacterium gallinarum]
MITLNKSSISLTQNIFVPELIGDNKFIAWNDDGTNKILYEYDSIFLLSTDESASGEEVTISIDSDFNLAVGNYEYEIIAKSLDGLTVEKLKIYLKVINEDTTPEEKKPYKLKYQFENEPAIGEFFKCEIHERGYTGDLIHINGKAEYRFQEKSDLFQPIVASNLNLKLLADENVNLQDLYSENEQHFKVFLKRNEQIIFVGFLKPDGIWEDYVFDKWELSIDVIDGLSTLKNISFSNENGISFSGKYKASDIIFNCLAKTGLNLPININCAIVYENSPFSYNVFETIFLNTERYFQNNSEPMDCESVLKSIIQLFNATLVQFNGEWYIFRSIDLIPGSMLGTVFNRYVNNVYESTFSLDPSVTIGSEINDSPIFHCNANQKKSISPSVQAYRVIYQYGNAKSVFENGELQLAGSGLDIPGWGINNFDGEVERQPNGKGLISKTLPDSAGDPTLLYLTQSIDINQDAVIKMTIQYGNYKTNTHGLRFAIGVGSKFFNIDSGEWQDVGVINTILNSSWDGYTYPGTGAKRLTGLGRATYELVVKSPISGNLVLTIYRDKHPVSGGYFDIYSVNVVPNDSGNIKGREYTAQRTKKISTVTKPNITLYNGDSVSDLFVGTIYKSDGDTPTEKWWRLNDPEPREFKELLSINAEDNLRISPRPMIIFEGDVKGYIPYISLITINNVADKFQPTSYSFDTSTGILKLTSREFSSDLLEIGKDYKMEVKDNYGNESKVTIV